MPSMSTPPPIPLVSRAELLLLAQTKLREMRAAPRANRQARLRDAKGMSMAVSFREPVKKGRPRKLNHHKVILQLLKDKELTLRLDLKTVLTLRRILGRLPLKRNGINFPQLSRPK